MMPTLLAALHILFMTTLLGSVVLVASALGVKERAGSIYERCAKLWARSLLKVSGVDVIIHGRERIAHGEPRIYVSNHVSWFDVFALASVLPRFRFVAKAELSRIPLFGPAAGKAAAIYIERANRKAAFDSYKAAVDEVRKGYAVCVYPEGTRGYSYSLRPFKKGPFVFAIAAGVPIVPVVTFGTIDIQPKGRARVRPGTVQLHFLEEVPTAGLQYEDRAQLMITVWERMAAALRDLYGVESHGGPLARDPEAEKIKTSFL